jgi:trimethylamine--corrinoid protein Co-methyltransferase
MKLRSLCPEALDDRELDQICEASVRVATRVPLRLGGASEGGRENNYTDQLLAALREFGCEIRDNEYVTFPDAVMDRVMAAISEHKAGMPTEFPDFPNKLSYSTSGQGLWCCDIEDDSIRAATTRDLADLSRVVDAIDGLGRSHPTFLPQDVPISIVDVHAFATIILNSSVPYRVSIYNADVIEHFIELDTLARGGDREAVLANPTFASKAWFNTPFMLTGENIDIGMKTRELMGSPLTVSTMPLAGAATPVTLAGCLAHSTAEVLQCNVISMAVDDRLMGWTAGPLTIDPRTGAHTQSGPAVQLLLLGASEVASHLFGGQVTAGGGPTTTAKVPGTQSMMEKSLETAWAIMGGTRSFGSLAVLAVADVGSIVQLMLDLEMMSHFERLLAGIEVTAETIAEEVIAEVAPRGAYFLGEDHTAEHFKSELWLPELVDSQVPMAWVEDPVTMVDNARAKARRLVETSENKCPLSDEERRQVEEIVADARRVVESSHA